MEEALPKTLKEAREQLERRMIRDALLRHQGRISDASRELGLSRATCIELALKLGIAVT